MANSVEDIKKLRDMTGAGMMSAKAALEEAAGDIEKAILVLRKKGQAQAAKKAGRQTKAGLVDAYVHLGRVGVLIEVNCETDFVARTEDFTSFVHEMAMQVAAANPLYLNQDGVPEAVIAKERQLYKDELKEDPKNAQKPAAILEKIIDGKLQKYMAEVCLLEQPSIKDQDKKVADLLTELIAKLGENIVISRFSRFELGGGDA